MVQYGIKGCPVCAWRGTCVIKHRFEAGTSQNCVEFTKDITLKVDSSEEKEPLDYTPNDTDLPDANKT
jgi:hypothetical protein